MIATVKILPGAVDVINENTFPWHGLIVTANQHYSTKYRFGDFNWGFLSEDSVLQPSGLIGPPTDAFIDSDGNGVGGKPYTIVIQRVELEARTRADGPYDLKATFVFSADDPIVKNGITRTNKPADLDSGPRATPYALTEEVERLPTFKMYAKEDQRLSMWVEAHEPQYHEILELVSDYPQNAFGSYILPIEAYMELEAKYTPEQAERREVFDSLQQHSSNIDAFRAGMEEISADRVISQDESEHICFALDQWTTQMTAARDFAQVHSDAISRYPVGPITSIEDEAEKALKLLEEAECQ